MNNSPLAEKIVSLRKSKGFSQEELAENAAVNLRTIQRIENSETEPRGQTIRLIAKALDTPLEDFLDFTKEEDAGYLQLMNLSALSFWVIPLGNIFLPLVFWITKKDKVKGVGELGRRIINFQITWSFLTYGTFIIAIISLMTGFPGTSPWSPFLVMGAIGVLYIVNSILILLASIQISRGAEKIYYVGLKIIR